MQTLQNLCRHSVASDLGQHCFIRRAALIGKYSIFSILVLFVVMNGKFCRHLANTASDLSLNG